MLALDLETAPILGWTWGMWQTDVIEIVQNTFILSFAYRWMDQKTTKVVSLRQFRGYRKGSADDRKLCEALWELLDQSDAVIAHNGDKFDLRKIQARFLVHKLPPPRPFMTVDTLKIARKHFFLDSNKQDEIGKQLGTGRKLEHSGKNTWLGAMKGDPKHWRTMERYNAADVDLLIENYKRLEPWAIWKPNKKRPIEVKV